MKVSEKSLELNVGAEILNLMRTAWGMPKAYLRGLTQQEEKQEGVDCFAELPTHTKIFAFQFKAPRGAVDAAPYKYKIQRQQHDLLYQLSQLGASGVFYVFPYYVTLAKLQQQVPNLMQDTWLLDIHQVPTAPAFGTAQSRTVRCINTTAFINPEYRLERLHDARPPRDGGIDSGAFARWYGRFREIRGTVERLNLFEGREIEGRRNPWLARGLRVAIVQPG